MYVCLCLFNYPGTIYHIFYILFLAIIDDSELTVPLLNGTRNGSIPISGTQKEQPPEGAQDKTDTATDKKGELCDLSVHESM